MIQVNAGGNWTSDDDLAALLMDVFGQFNPCDVKVRGDSSVYSVTNKNAFGESMGVDISELLSQMQKCGSYSAIKYLDVTGGLTFDLKNPKCKPQIQKTGTVYIPFCVDPRKASLEVLEILLQFSETIQKREDKLKSASQEPKATLARKQLSRTRRRDKILTAVPCSTAVPSNISGAKRKRRQGQRSSTPTPPKPMFSTDGDMFEHEEDREIGSDPNSEAVSVVRQPANFSPTSCLPNAVPTGP